MKSFDVNELEKKQIYKFLIGSILPRPIALIATLNEDHSVNLAPFSYFNIVSYDPPVISVSIIRKDGQLKDTSRNILTHKEATVHVVTDHLLEEANQASAPLAYGQSELDRMNVEIVESLKIQPPGIKEAPVRFETVLKQHVPIEDAQGQPKADLMLLEIKQFHFNEAILDGTYVDLEHLQPVSRLAGPNYSYVGKVVAMERPKE